MNKKIIMKSENKCKSSKSAIKSYYIAAIISIFIFILIYGIYVLNPTYTDWLLEGGDLSQHYLGWKAYREGAWTFPIGLTDQLAYPYYTSIIFTDSIPLMAVPFKLFSFILPENFQYFGIWGILCFILQGIFAVKIISKFINNSIVIILLSSLFCITPVMIWRMYGHTSLAGHWIILMALDVLFSYNENKDYLDKVLYKWFFIGVLSSMIHIYFVLMCGIILCGYCLLDWLYTKKLKRSILSLMLYIIAVIFTVWILGGFSSEGSVASGEGLGFYSFNLNALFNPQGWSCIFKDLPCGEGQYEGFAYLGLGWILLLICVIVLLIAHDNIKSKFIDNYKKCIAIMSIIIVSIIIAASPIVTIGSKTLITLNIPDFINKLWSIFRASGRISWIVVYIIMIVLSYGICKITKEKSVIIIISICLIIQMYDIHGVLISKNDYFNQKVVHESIKKNEAFWDSIGNNDTIKHVYLLGSFSTEELFEYADWTTSNSKTLNKFHFAHNTDNSDEINNAIQKALSNKNISDLFIFAKDNQFKYSSYDLNYYTSDGYVIGYIDEFSELSEQSINISDMYYNYKIGDEMLLSSDNSVANKVFYQGISQSEDSHTWTDGADVKMIFKITDDDIPSQLHAKFDILTVFNSQQHVDVYVNGANIYSDIIKNEDDLEFDFNVPDDKVVSIELKIPNAVSPLDLGMSQDSRLLGLALTKVSFQPIK